jgi:hypothetical protein
MRFRHHPGLVVLLDTEEGEVSKKWTDEREESASLSEPHENGGNTSTTLSVLVFNRYFCSNGVLACGFDPG